MIRLKKLKCMPLVMNVVPEMVRHKEKRYR